MSLHVGVVWIARRRNGCRWRPRSAGTHIEDVDGDPVDGVLLGDDHHRKLVEAVRDQHRLDQEPAAGPSSSPTTSGPWSVALGLLRGPRQQVGGIGDIRFRWRHRPQLTSSGNAALLVEPTDFRSTQVIVTVHYLVSHRRIRCCTRWTKSAIWGQKYIITQTRNSSGDEIANVNFLCDDIHALKYNILLHKFRHRSFSATQVNQLQWNIQIMQCNGHYAVQGHSRSPILVPIESSYTTSYYIVINNYLLSCTVCKLWLIIGQIFASESGVSHFIALTGGDTCQYHHKWYIAKN